jgi:predicted  nucleic acid-binding Zn-ribbon protein
VFKSPRAQKRANKWYEVQQIKLEQGCTDCGYRKSAYALQFDHISEDKKDSVSNLIRSDYAWETILTEIAKCEVVCANCHAIRTHQRKHDNGVSSQPIPLTVA